jgi:hypothetical protein
MVPKFNVIVNLAVKNDPYGSILVTQWLLGSGEIDDT